MNVHNKLKSLGFTKTDFYKINDSMSTCKDALILDNYVRKLMPDSKGKLTYVNIVKNHPKSNSFWKFVFNEQYILWISVVSNRISAIMLEDKNTKEEFNHYYRKDVKILYSKDEQKVDFNISSKNDILKVLPNNIKREFILKDIIK